MVADEDTLEIPGDWRERLETLGGGLSAAAARKHLSELDMFATDEDAAAVYSLVMHEGTGALAAIEDALPAELDYMDAGLARALGEALSVIPSDAAFQSLLWRCAAPRMAQIARPMRAGLDAACRRFPRRALRLTALHASRSGATRNECRSILPTLVRRHPELAARLAPELDKEAAELVADLLGAAAERTDAPLEALPAVLREPPWTRKKRKRKRAVIDLSPLPFEDRMAWGAEEQRRWASSELPSEAALRRLEHAPWTPALARFLPALIARLELDALPAVEAVARSSPKDGVPLLLPFRTARLAPIVAEAFLRLKSARNDARRWLLRHHEAAAVGLVPVALGADAKQAKIALAGLGLLLRNGRRDVLARAAERYGPAACEALLSALDDDALAAHPARLPAMPAFWEPATLPALQLASGQSVPTSALEPLGAMLAFSKDEPYAGIAEVKAACDPRSLAELSWAIFEAWLRAGADSKHSWAMWQLAWLGDDDCALALEQLMRDWPAQGSHKRALLGLDVLAAMHDEMALVMVHQLSQKARSKSLKRGALTKLEQIADERGLTADQLADRLCPTLGLDEAGVIELDFGARKLTATFDEHLQPIVRDEAGRLLKTLPKPGKSDDAALAADSARRFVDLKRNVRTLARTQLRRLEDALVRERRWSATDFRRFVVGHPLLVHVARRLVWLAKRGDQAVSFRVAEDKTFASVEDDAFELADDAEVFVAHPLVLGEALTEKWRGQLADYELLQPFAQLRRETYAAAGERTRSDLVAEATATPVHGVRLRALETNGWQRGHVVDGPTIGHYEREIGDGLRATLELSPGIFPGGAASSEEQTLSLHVTRSGAAVSLDALAPVAFSELLRGLHALRG